jgi:hypothetical protein
MAATSQQWEVTAASAGASQRELMERLVGSAADLESATSQLRAAEEGRLSALREAETARQAAAQAEAEIAAVRALLDERWVLGLAPGTWPARAVCMFPLLRAPA